MQSQDTILFYVSTIRKWTGTASITSGYFEDYAPVWKPTTRGEQYPFRVNLSPEITLEEGQFIDALFLAPRLDYLKRWAPEDWPLAFADRLHLLPQRDFRLIETEMRRVSGQHGRPHKRRRHKSKRPPDLAGTAPVQVDGGDSAAPSPTPEAQGQQSDSPPSSLPQAQDGPDLLSSGESGQESSSPIVREE